MSDKPYWEGMCLKVRGQLHKARGDEEEAGGLSVERPILTLRLDSFQGVRSLPGRPSSLSGAVQRGCLGLGELDPGHEEMWP